MNMSDICAEILDRFFRFFVRKKIRRIHIPERGKIVAGEGFEYFAELRSIAEQSAGLEQKSNPGGLRLRKQIGDQPRDRGFVAVAVSRSVHAHVRNMEIAGYPDTFAELGQRIGTRGFVRRIADTVYTGNA